MTTTASPPATSPVAPCPACGAWSLPALAERSALLEVCNVLVVTALASLGRKIVRQPRSRFKEFGARPWHVAHTVWRADPKDVDRTLDSAWDVLPALLSTRRADALGITSEQVTTCLDEYVRLLLERGLEHEPRSLRYWLAARLSITFPEETA
jgi:hypothetical protein